MYDSANQLIRENNQSQTYTYTWSYDSAGNIQDYKTYNYTTDDISTATLRATDGYTYGNEDWGDLLTAFDGNAITYDEIGNPLSDATRTFTWEHGRQMATQTKNGVKWEYTYDANGMRTSRSSDTKTYDYVYSGDKLVQMTVTDTTANTTQLLEFAYDAAGQPLTMTLDGVIYYYLLNIQGDVMGLVDGSGNLLAAFSYTAYGKAYSVNNVSSMGTTLASANPLTYRGYVMDAGTGLYYLQSRYYDPTLGRFLNADAFTSTGQGLLGNNMFTYCHNNPILYVDPTGCIIVLASDATEEQIAEYERAIAYLKTSETGRKLIELLENSAVVFTVDFCDDDEMYYNPSSNTIYFDVNSGLILGDRTSVQSAALGLAHEMGHAAQHLDGLLCRSEDEVEALNLERYETPIAKELGEPVRNDYRDARGTMNMANSIHFRTTSSELRPVWHYFFFWNWGKSKYLPIDHSLDG